jgi:hypothetical protein
MKEYTEILERTKLTEAVSVRDKLEKMAKKVGEYGPKAQKLEKPLEKIYGQLEVLAKRDLKGKDANEVENLVIAVVDALQDVVAAARKAESDINRIASRLD